MNEIKQVYQVRTVPHGWQDIPKEKYQNALDNLEIEGRILYPATAYEALQKEKDKIEDELDQYKEHHEELTEHYKALQFLESEFRKENAELQAENDDQKRKIISLENELVEWNEFKKIRDAQMQALRKQML